MVSHGVSEGHPEHLYAAVLGEMGDPSVRRKRERDRFLQKAQKQTKGPFPFFQRLLHMKDFSKQLPDFRAFIQTWQGYQELSAMDVSQYERKDQEAFSQLLLEAQKSLSSVHRVRSWMQWTTSSLRSLLDETVGKNQIREQVIACLGSLAVLDDLLPPAVRQQEGVIRPHTSSQLKNALAHGLTRAFAPPHDSQEEGMFRKNMNAYLSNSTALRGEVEEPTVLYAHSLASLRDSVRQGMAQESLFPGLEKISTLPSVSHVSSDKNGIEKEPILTSEMIIYVYCLQKTMWPLAEAREALRAAQLFIRSSGSSHPRLVPAHNPSRFSSVNFPPAALKDNQVGHRELERCLLEGDTAAFCRWVRSQPVVWKQIQRRAQKKMDATRGMAG